MTPSSTREIISFFVRDKKDGVLLIKRILSFNDVLSKLERFIAGKI